MTENGIDVAVTQQADRLLAAYFAINRPKSTNPLGRETTKLLRLLLLLPTVAMALPLLATMLPPEATSLPQLAMLLPPQETTLPLLTPTL